MKKKPIDDEETESDLDYDSSGSEVESLLKKQPRLADLEDDEGGFEAETDSEDEALQEAFAQGKLKPGLNLPAGKTYVNNVEGMSNKLEEISQSYPWIERLDVICKPAPLPPELAHQMKLSEKDTFAYDELKHESLFYRQAQSAVLECIPRLHELGIKTKRPDDYFAEMAKSDAHMLKVKEALIKKKAVVDRIEKVRQMRLQKKMQKAIHAQSKVAKQTAKSEFLNEVKKFRKGERKDLGFLEGKPQPKKKLKTPRYRDEKYGFGGKKRGNKRNTRDSTMGFEEKKGKGKQGNSKKPQRPGKNRRKQIKNKKK